MQFADIILPLSLPRPLTYGIPLKLQDKVQVGMRVEVNMGRDKLYAGLVFKLHDQKPEAYHVKPVRAIIDEAPILNQLQISLWQWISDYYVCGLGEVMQVGLPAHLKLMSESLLLWSNKYDDVPQGLSDDGFILAEALLIRKQLTIGEVRHLIEGKNSSKIINELLETEAVIVSEILEEQYKPKQEKFVFLEARYELEVQLREVFDQLERSPKQLAVLMTFLHLRKNYSGVPVSEVIRQSKAASCSLNALVEKGILRTELITVDRLQDFSLTKSKHHRLNALQEATLEQIKLQWTQKDTCLLQGVTGSGKTHIYIQLIKECIDAGKQALFMLPEIALTTQILARLRDYFGSELGVYHSKYSNNERIEVWRKVQSGAYKVVIGPRSAVWLPYTNLGLVIVDEEHDASYKQQDPAPRFHARDVAITLAKLHKAHILLGTATPSIESASNVQKGKFGYVALKQRFMGVAMPSIQTVNAKNTQAALSPILTTDLLEEMQKTIQAGKQVILFQNKRGYAPFLICGACGFVPHCKYCDVSLTYHKSSDKLHCHYCGSKSAPIKHCPQCGNAQITARTFGTEKIEEDLTRIFAQYKIARMDWDSMRTKGRQIKLIEDFSLGKIDVLVGTQMVVKGLDFDNVGLVGILSADSLLSFPDFRVNERGFQLMEQVSGRAGRADGAGKVLIQTHNALHPIIGFVKQHDYNAFYSFEIINRQQYYYPPYCRLIRIAFKHKDPLKAGQGAALFTQQLREAVPTLQIHGPTPALVPRIRNMYIHEILIKMPLDGNYIGAVKTTVRALSLSVPATKGYSGLHIVIDVDPV